MNAFQLLTRDVAVKATTKCGQFRLVAVSTRGVLHETMTRHQLFPTPDAIASLQANKDDDDAFVLRDTPAQTALPQLGNLISAANLWAALLNNEERVRVEFQGAHAVPIAESLALGETRAFLQPPRAVEGATSGGLRVQRALYAQKEPFLSATVAPGCSPMDVSLAHQVRYHCAQSDGVPAAVMFATSFDRWTGVPDYNVGVMVQPIAPSENRTSDALEVLGSLQRAFRAVMVDDDEEAQQAGLSVAAIRSVRDDFSKRAKIGLAIHDLFGLATGDWSGVSKLADSTRQLGGESSRRMLEAQLAAFAKRTDAPTTADLQITANARGALEAMNRDASGLYPVVVQPMAPPLSAWLGWDPTSHGVASLELDPDTIVRTPLDFHCRCSKGGFMTALRAVGLPGVKGRRAANPDMDFKCMHCMRIWRLDPADWDAVEKSLGA